MRRVAALVGVLAGVSLVAACNVERPIPDGLGVNTPRYGERDTIKIGALTVLDGDLAASGQNELNAAILAAEQVNALGGILGRRVEIVFRDYKGEAELAAKLAKELVMEEGVIGILGASGSGASLAVAGAIQELKNVDGDRRVPQISCCSTSKALTTFDDDGFLFRASPSDVLQAKVVADLVATGTHPTKGGALVTPDKNGMKTGAIIWIDNAYGSGFNGDLAENFAALSSVRIVKSVKYPETLAGLTETQAVVREVLDAVEDPDEIQFLILVAYDDTGAQIVNQYISAIGAGATPPVLIPTDGAQSDRFAQIIADAGNGGRVFPNVLGTAPGAYPGLGGQYTFFSNTFKATYGVAPYGFAPHNYDGAMVMMLAAQYAGSTAGADVRDALYVVSALDVDNPERNDRYSVEELANALRAADNGDNLDYIGVTGDMDFNADGDVESGYILWKIVDNAIGTAAYVVGDQIVPVN